MNTFISLFTTKEIIIMGCVILSLFLGAFIMFIWDLVSKRKEIEDDFKDFEEQINLTEEIATEDGKVVSENVELSVTSVVEGKQDDKVEQVVEPLIIDFEEDTKEVVDNASTSQEQAKIELEKITKELTTPKNFEDTLSNIEMMEEQNAIISYQELLETTKEMNIVLADSGDEPISINEIFNKYDDNDQNVETIANINEVYNKEFTSSPCISPIGEYEKENLAEIQLENTANLEKLDKEIRKTNQFLSILNELKKNLE